ncbi:hypothetical protein COLO4_34279 [Corchorus olitorius]|uniref:Uncharacterized protein n=1 Tax=Corchorus olitorius TaxID=93759 RepID=A0A1R3GMG3_9ROSI|nr:hypothetical protein COLO4_34279 [Corchorus olitorius]
MASALRCKVKGMPIDGEKAGNKGGEELNEIKEKRSNIMTFCKMKVLSPSTNHKKKNVNDYN